MQIAMQVDDESKINQTELQLNAFAVEQGLEEEQEEEEEEEEDNWTPEAITRGISNRLVPLNVSIGTASGLVSFCTK